LDASGHLAGDAYLSGLCLAHDDVVGGVSRMKPANDTKPITMTTAMKASSMLLIEYFFSLIVCRWEGREGWEGWGE
ncbi:MAG: hypothetical protein ACFNQE_04425, partial [Capnocytophaga leadbetteri]